MICVEWLQGGKNCKNDMYQEIATSYKIQNSYFVIGDQLKFGLYDLFY